MYALNAGEKNEVVIWHLCFVWLQEKIGGKENERERKEERNCFLLLCLVGEKSEKKENRRKNIFFYLIE